MALKALNNVTVKCGAYEIPILRAVVDDIPTKELTQSIAEIISNRFAISSIFVNAYDDYDNVPVFMRNWDVGTHTMGDDDGFKLVTTVGLSPYSRYTDRVSVNLFYLGNLVAFANGVAGTGSRKMIPLIIYTTTDYDIYKPVFSGGSGNTAPTFYYESVLDASQFVDTYNVIFTYSGNYTNIYGMTSTFNSASIIGNIEDEITSETDPDETDPYGPDGYSGHGGGTGTFSRTGDSIGIPSLPTLSAVDTGFISLYNPSVGQLQALGSYLWGANFDLETFKKIFTDPMGAILGLSIVPVNVPTSGSRNVKIGNTESPISMPRVSTQYVAVDCGTLNVQEYWGSYMDYAPYTKVYIYLPYCGTHPLDVDDVMGKSVRVVYHVDILSGACIAFIQCGGTVIYSFEGQCSASIPITANDWTNVINGVLGIAGSIGSMVAGIGANLTTGNASGAFSSVVGGMASIGANVMSSKQNVEKSGAMAGAGGMLGVQTPYLIINWPRQAIPKHQNKHMGYPSMITVTLGEIHGYTEVLAINMEGLTCTDAEATEIETLLKSGVIL